MGLRNWWLILWTLMSNSFWKFLPGGKLYTGTLKSFCHPGLNCYSCPAAVFACPMGSLQFFMAALRSNWSLGIHQVGFYVLGFIGILGTLGGRFVCGWLCPFGFIQELLYKNPLPKVNLPKFLNYGKYLILAFMIFILPAFILDASGLGQVWFCKYLCPAGTLEAAVPLVILKPFLRSSIGSLFFLKLVILIFLLGLMLISRRPFCRTLCPLGGFYALFNKVSALRMQWDSKACTHCEKCFKICPMELKFYEGDNQANCIRCFKCKESCAFGAIRIGVRE
jgi:ferredoxin-type protein NapH